MLSSRAFLKFIDKEKSAVTWDHSSLIICPEFFSGSLGVLIVHLVLGTKQPGMKLYFSSIPAAPCFTAHGR